mmetsp:Transcript_23530/g.66981  ORF Transcript_23530/g.66981 Transcript_23530/m.66981 type:complete len:143 (+) Transcript_23530:174-602(+)
MWTCPFRGNRDRTFFGPFFDKTYGNKPTKEPKRFDSIEVPRPQDRSRCKKRYATLEKCSIGDAVLKCPWCDHVRRWPTEKLAVIDDMEVERTNGQARVVKLEQKSSDEMRTASQWYKMRQHCLGHAKENEELPNLYLYPKED